MPFDKVETQVDFPAQERAILAYWQKIDAFNKLREQNRGKPRWSFLDGPITANNPMGVHHAWGRTYKDAYQRYFAMTGHEERYQNGFDCQGLWVEVEVEKELKLQSKRDIESLVPGDRFASIDKFVNECKARVDKFAKIQTAQSIRLGYWMDWDREEDWSKPADQRRSYFTMSEENNYTIWAFLKKCHERGLIYRGYDAMPWCPRCGVGISQMEMNEGYRNVAHRAVFIRFPLRDRPGENLLAWTTTPWTLTSNVAAAVNPELTYLRVKQGDQIYYVGKGAFTARRKEEEFKNKTEWVEGVPKLKSLEQIFKEKKGGFEIVGEVKGAEMVGWAYDGPFDEFAAQHQAHGYPEELVRVVIKQKWAPAVSGKDAHRVVPWNDVSEAEGTGIVHIAPGCGKEDFQLGKQVGLPPIAPLTEDGVYLDGFGELTGKQAVLPETAEWVITDLQKKNLLFATEKYPHRYPHCWRCKTELLYRLVDEWFIAMSWREEIMNVCKDIRWIPKDGLDRELDWLKNMGDWMISKKRYWGLALPIWVDEQTGEFEVIGSREELQKRAVEGWPKFDGHTPHKPWLDLVKIRNPRGGNLMSRIPDVGNPWLDAGIVAYSTMSYNTNRAEWEKWFPADFITESFPGQFRNWFYALLAMSTMMTGKAPFKALLGHALVRDQRGEDMHKSKGNAIPFDGATDTGYKLFHHREPKQKPEAQAHKDLPEGWLPDSVMEETITLDGKQTLVVSAAYPPMGADEIRWLFCRHNPVNNINFGPGPAEELRSKFLLKLWNTYAFFCNYARLDGFDPAAPQVPVKDRPDIDRWIISDLQLLIQKAHEAFKEFDVQSFCLETERFVDDRLSNWYVRRNRRRFWKSEKGTDKTAAYQTLYTVLLTLTKLMAPVMPFLAEAMYRNLSAGMGKASVHHESFPTVEGFVDEELSSDMDALLYVVSLGFSLRNMGKAKVRQPLVELRIQPATDSFGRAIERAVKRFPDQIKEELNVKKVSLHDAAASSLLEIDVKPNLKTLGPKLGNRLKDATTALAKLSVATLAKTVGAGQPLELSLDGEIVKFDPVDLVVQTKASAGWVGLADRGTQLALDTRITEELALEGLAREGIRHVQQARKDGGLQMEDRILLHLQTDAADLQKAIETHRDYIASETLVARWSAEPLGDEAYKTNVKVEGKALTIHLSKAAT
ncbi:MAG TPA: isoleucine--tRNA ligase [Gemmataceae bacterium]|nr:isoleucine--tRNA ligase [Gemmataceae bacterium]